MNKEIKRKWLKALRSGKYKQARTYLKKRNGAMCCLGVLEHKVLGVPYTWDSLVGVYRNSAGITGEPASRVRDSVALTSSAARELIRMNDDKGMSFSEIADWIEKNL